MQTIEDEQVDALLVAGDVFDTSTSSNRAHSLPIMESIRVWGHDQLNSHHVETNSGLGKAIRYFDNHFDGLSGFCQHVGDIITSLIDLCTSRY